MPKTTLPSRLYKYQPFNAYTLANLKQASIWFSAPINFNDPYDCALSIVDPDKLTDSDVKRALDYFVQRQPMSPKLKADMCPDGVPTPAFREELVNSVRRVYDERRTIQLEQRGVACFSEHCMDITMWSHYADGHRGFCLEFDTSRLPFTEARQVCYSESVPSINPVDVLVEDHSNAEDDELLWAFVLTKAQCWSYEREWRLMHAEASKLYGYGDHALTGVYFGTAMPDAHKEIICLVMRDAPIQFHEVLRDDRSFSLHSRAVTYTPYVYQARKPADSGT